MGRQHGREGRHGIRRADRPLAAAQHIDRPVPAQIGGGQVDVDARVRDRRAIGVCGVEPDGHDQAVGRIIERGLRVGRDRAVERPPAMFAPSISAPPSIQAPRCVR